MHLDFSNKGGSVLIEAIVAIGLLAILISGTIFLLVENVKASTNNTDMQTARLIAQEGIEAAHSIKNEWWCGLYNGAHGVNSTILQRWVFVNTSDTVGRFTRIVSVSDVYRDSTGELVTDMNLGTIDPTIKKVTATVQWSDITDTGKELSLETYISNWRGARNGMLVYADAGPNSGKVVARKFEGATNSWGPETQIFPSTSGKVSRVELYSAPTRDEKIVVAKHIFLQERTVCTRSRGCLPGGELECPEPICRVRRNLATVFNAQVYRGCYYGWSNPVQIDAWAGQWPDLKRFDGTYLNNGDFMLIYSNETNVPQYRIWNGTSWSIIRTLPNIGAIPNQIVARARPGTNEVMVAFFDSNADTKTIYFNGGTYALSSWSAPIVHATDADALPRDNIDYVWSRSNPLVGGLIYTDAKNDSNMNIKTWTANGFGSGSWSATAEADDIIGPLGPLSITSRGDAEEFTACAQKQTGSHDAVCYTSDFTPALSNPINQILSNTSPSHLGVDVIYEGRSGNEGLAVYSDSSNIPQLKKLDATTQTWDSSATTLAPLTYNLETVRIIPQRNDNDAMIVLADTNQNLYTSVWDGDTNALYSTPTGLSLTDQSAIGVDDDILWYDFEWDNY